MILDKIAIISMGIELPNVNDLNTLYSVLNQKHDQITRLSLSEARQKGVRKDKLSNPNYIPVSGMLTSKFELDFRKFKFTQEEYESTDPQIRVLFKIIHDCLSNVAKNIDNSRCAVVASMSANNYLNDLLKNKGIDIFSPMAYKLQALNKQDFLAMNLAYRLNLKGPAINVLTGCSSGLSGVITAIELLKDNRCDYAIAAASSIISYNEFGYIKNPFHIFSDDGYCKAFDDNATGTIPGSGAVCFLLKRLSDAQRDNDTILAVIEGYGINNDGNDKPGITAPSIKGQFECLQQAYSESLIDKLAYIECHGTGTKLGDPIEIAGLDRLFDFYNYDRNIYIGSTKSNFGHTDVSAGSVGLAKLLAILKNDEIPGQINFSQLNEDIENSQISVLTESRKIKNTQNYCVGVSSFGIGGTNTHIILSKQDDEQAKHNKPKRLIVREKFDTKVGAAEYAENKIKEIVRAIVYRNIDIDIIEDDADILHSGCDSLAIIEIIETLGKRFNVTLSHNKILNEPTINNLTETIEAETTNHELQLIKITTYTKNSDKNHNVPLILLHSGSGVTFKYERLLELLNWPVVHTIENPVLNDKKLGYESLDEMAIFYVKKILESDINFRDGVVLSGWSFGGNLAYCISNHLIRSGVKVKGIFLLDAWAMLPKSMEEELYYDKLSPFDYSTYKLKEGHYKTWIHQMQKRINFVASYRYANTKIKVILFKCEQCSPEYLTIDNNTNHWLECANNLEIIQVRGDHHSLLDDVNVVCLARKVSKACEELTK